MGKLLKLVGEYPTYVLQRGAFLAGAFCFRQKVTKNIKYYIFQCFRRLTKTILHGNELYRRAFENWYDSNLSFFC